MKTLYVIQSFTQQKVGNETKLLADTPILCDTAEDATNRAESLANDRDGVIAAAQQYDEDSNEYGVFTILTHYGVIPDDIFERDLLTLFLYFPLTYVH